MSDTSRHQLADHIVVSMPRFGYWATSIRDFETPYGKVGYRQLEVLWAIRHGMIDEDPVTPSAITAHFGVQASVVTRILARLEAHEFIDRLHDPEDGRRVSIEITARGLHVSEYVEALYHQEALAALAFLSDDEIERLRAQVDVLDRVATNLLENRKHRAAGSAHEEG